MKQEQTKGWTSRAAARVANL